MPKEPFERISSVNAFRAAESLARIVPGADRGTWLSAIDDALGHAFMVVESLAVEDVQRHPEFDADRIDATPIARALVVALATKDVDAARTEVARLLDNAWIKSGLAAA